MKHMFVRVSVFLRMCVRQPDEERQREIVFLKLMCKHLHLKIEGSYSLTLQILFWQKLAVQTTVRCQLLPNFVHELPFIYTFIYIQNI